MGLFSNFFGGESRKHLNEGFSAYSDQIERSKNRARGEITSGFDKAQTFYEPYSQFGLGAQNLYSQYLGTDGPEARTQFFEDYADPYLESATQYGIDALDKSAAARGTLFSSGQLRDVGDYSTRLYYDMIQPYLGRLGGAAGLGANIAEAQAGLEAQRGGLLGNIEMGTGQLLGNQRVALGNALADTENVGMNNMLGLLGIGGKVAGAYYGAR